MPTTNSTVTLAIAAHDQTAVFDPSLEGVDPITKAGTSIPATQEKAVRRLARQNGVSIRGRRPRSTHAST